ncbi:hypothetical protein FRC09_006963 [Ceratobasidium sp. 395]|nr:hypothetical protein FRC09_006963 [Ceratobasidium sp. 395]
MNANRGEQIVQRLFFKVVLLIWDARATNREQPPGGARVDKWFHLEVRDDGMFPGLAQELGELASEGQGPLELCVRTVLLFPHLAPPAAQALVLLSEPTSTTTNTTATARRTRVDMPPTARGILLEEWTLSLDWSSAQPPAQQADNPLPAVYKQAIALFRSLFALLRYLPSWRLHRGLGAGAPMQITVGPSLGADPLDEDILGFEHRLVPDDPGPSIFPFPPISTPLGSITLRARYRPNARFRLDPLENLWSSALASAPPSPGAQALAPRQQGPGPSNSTSPASPSPPTPARAPITDFDSPAFTPTLLANRQRQSLTGSGSPLRPASRTGAAGTSTTPTVPGAGLPPIRPRTVSQLSSGGELGLPRRPVLGMAGEPGSPRRTVYDISLSPRSPPSPRLGTEQYGGEGGGGSGLTRTRLLSTGGRTSGSSTPFGATGGTGLVLGNTIREGPGGDIPPSPRRTSSSINPFKGPTIASSPARISPLGLGMGAGSPRTTPGLGLGTSPRSALGVGGEAQGRRSLEGGEGGAQPQPIVKRYEGSFGHRAMRSQGSLGSGSAGTGTGVPGSIGTGMGVPTSFGVGAGGGGGPGSSGTGVPGSLGAAVGGAGGGVGSVGAVSTGSGGGQGPSRLATIESQSYASQLDDDESIGEFLALIDKRPQLGLDVTGSASTTERRASGSLLRRPPLSALGTEGMGTQQFPLSSPIQERRALGSPIQDRLPLDSPIQGRLTFDSPVPARIPLPSTGGEPEPSRAERFPPSSLPARYSALPPVSPDVPRPLPPPLQSIPPSPAESAFPWRQTRDRSTSRERGGMRGYSRERGARPFGDAVLAPLPEQALGDRVRAMSLAERPSSALRERHERERTTSFARRMLTNRDEVEAAVQLMTASFAASYAPPSSPGAQLGESSGRGDEIVGRLELGGSGSVGGRSAGSLRPGRDTDTWREAGGWDQRAGGWR